MLIKTHVAIFDYWGWAWVMWTWISTKRPGRPNILISNRPLCFSFSRKTSLWWANTILCRTLWVIRILNSILNGVSCWPKLWYFLSLYIYCIDLSDTSRAFLFEMDILVSKIHMVLMIGYSLFLRIYSCRTQYGYIGMGKGAEVLANYEAEHSCCCSLRCGTDLLITLMLTCYYHLFSPVHFQRNI